MSAWSKGVQGLFAEPSRGFCFLAEAVLPGATGAPCSLLVLWVFFRLSLLFWAHRPCPQNCAPAFSPGQSSKGLGGGQASPQEPAFCSTLLPAEAGVGGRPAQECRVCSIRFLPTSCRELPMKGSCRKGRGARPQAVLQGPEAGIAAHQDSADPQPVARPGAA